MSNKASGFVLPRIFDHVIRNSSGRQVAKGAVKFGCRILKSRVTAPRLFQVLRKEGITKSEY